MADPVKSKADLAAYAARMSQILMDENIIPCNTCELNKQLLDFKDLVEKAPDDPERFAAAVAETRHSCLFKAWVSLTQKLLQQNRFFSLDSEIASFKGLQDQLSDDASQKDKLRILDSFVEHLQMIRDQNGTCYDMMPDMSIAEEIGIVRAVFPSSANVPQAKGAWASLDSINTFGRQQRAYQKVLELYIRAADILIDVLLDLTLLQQPNHGT